MATKDAARSVLAELLSSQSGNPLITQAAAVIEELMGEVNQWRALAIEAAAIEAVMRGIGMQRCAFCRAPAAPDCLPAHHDGCLVLRVRAADGPQS